jgi:sugar porter (SP) family MFS transporter
MSTPVEVKYAQVSTPPTKGNDLLLPDDTELRKSIKPNFVLYTSCFLGLLMPLQYGWSTSQLNYSKFNKKADCDARPVKEGTCIMFPGHSKLEWTFVVNAWILGGMIGCLCVGRFADKLGRKRVLQFNCGLIIVGAVLMASAYNLWQFVIGRLIAGLASGATTGNLGSYINEVAPPHLRSMLGVILHSGITIGILSVATTFFYLDFHDGWRIIAAFPIVLAVVFLALSPFVMVESPVWLLLKGKREEAEQVLTRLYGPENVSVALGWIEAKRKHDPEMQSSWSQAGHEVVRDGKSLPFSELLKPVLRRQFIIAVGLAAMQKITGINTVFYYSSDLFSEAGLKNGRVATIIIDIVNMVPTLISGFFSSRFGNRTMLLAGVGGMLISAIGLTLALSFDISWLTILMMATYVGSFGISLGPLLYVVIADIFPDYARATVTAIGVMVAWLSNLIVGIGYPYVADALKHLEYLPFIVMLALSLAFVFVLVPETEGKTNEEIQEEFRAIRKREEVAARS